MSVRSFLSTRRREAVLDLYNILLAAFLFTTPWLFAYSNQATRWDMWITGAAVAAIALLAIVAYAAWEEWVNVALGIWLVVSPWLLGFAHTRAMHFSIGIGLAVILMALIELMLGYDPPQEILPLPRS
jgi:hypothetical protein